MSDVYAATANKAMYAEQAIDRPLSARIMANTNEHLDLSRQINQRLYELRDRLFGPMPPSVTGTADGRVQAPANGFADAYSGTCRELYNTLVLIDGVSAELANRL